MCFILYISSESVLCTHTEHRTDNKLRIQLQAVSQILVYWHTDTQLQTANEVGVRTNTLIHGLNKNAAWTSLSIFQCSLLSLSLPMCVCVSMQKYLCVCAVNVSREFLCWRFVLIHLFQQFFHFLFIEHKMQFNLIYKMPVNAFKFPLSFFTLFNYLLYTYF